MQNKWTTTFKSAIGIIALFLSLSSAFAQGFIYTNNNPAGANSVTAFSVSGSGALSQIAGSPFSTGGNGNSAGSFASSRINVSIISNHLYVSNDGSSSISAFSINSTTGSLTPVSGSPFSTGGSAGDGIALAPTSQFLFASNSSSSNISAFTINAVTGALTPVSGSPFAAGGSPRDIMATPDGKFLIVTFGSASSNIVVFSIGATGALTSISGSPFNGGSIGPAGIAINSSSTRAFIAYANGGATIVGVFDIASNGTLSPISGSPFSFASGVNSNDLVLNPSENLLCVSNQISNTVTSLSVAANGSLALVSGSPFSNTGGGAAQGLTMNSTGAFLYVWNDNSRVTAYSVAGNGSLSAISGSPFTTTASGVRGGITFFQGLDNVLPVELTSFSASVQGGAVSIVWRTGSEVSNAGFELQRAAEHPEHFQAIANHLSNPELAGLGTTSSGKSYSFTDGDPSLSVGTTYYYRLVDISTDGIRKEHAPLAVKIEGTETEQPEVSSLLRLHQLLPNPASDQMTLLFGIRESGTATVELFSTDGKRVATPIDSRAFSAGEHQEMISVKALDAGIYALAANGGNGITRSTVRGSPLRRYNS